MSDHRDPHTGPHSGRARARRSGWEGGWPIVTADDLAWREFHEPGAGRAGRSARALVLPSRRNGS